MTEENAKTFEPYAGVCYKFCCPLQVGSHPPYYCDMRKRLSEMSNDLELCEDCQKRYGAKTWGDIKERVIANFHDPMDRVMEILTSEDGAGADGYLVEVTGDEEGTVKIQKIFGKDAKHEKTEHRNE